MGPRNDLTLFEFFGQKVGNVWMKILDLEAIMYFLLEAFQENDLVDVLWNR